MGSVSLSRHRVNAHSERTSGEALHSLRKHARAAASCLSSLRAVDREQDFDLVAVWIDQCFEP